MQIANRATVVAVASILAIFGTYTILSILLESYIIAAVFTGAIGIVVFDSLFKQTNRYTMIEATLLCVLGISFLVESVSILLLYGVGIGGYITYNQIYS